MEENIKAQLPPRNLQTFWTLFKSCFIISACTFGGGMVIISMLQKKFADDLNWIDENEVMDMCAIAQSCPGVMAVNVSIILGYRVGGITGGLMTVLGTVVPPMIILSIISLFYVQFRSNHIVGLVLKGMQAGVAAVMLDITITMSGNVLKEKDAILTVMLIAAIVAVTFFSVDIIWIIVICGIIGGVCTALKTRKGADL